ncbi:MAG: bifunctional diaminohydroxyphosphoribosylaminopyrimidine deaminase/5-amino-6-(5-phosphoribosylamino)uracil reductase RibD [Gammaproteobacteria bacterium]|nr:MAG: bifunctional diaminohydroxyphosphoribosylaminopyrimidine deaminase/5-amino-6-(5-phosphoribosylamino)uracil reductase RibD [Gammaproteobacteria bacterium]
MSSDAEDFRWMAQALRLAARGLFSAHPNPRVGCVVVAGGRVVGEGWHRRTGGPHAEIVALQEAGGAAAGATAYVTLEPCCHHGRTPPCTEALVAAGVRRVVFAAADPNPQVAGGGVRSLTAAGVAVTAGVMEAEARALNVGFFSRMQRQRPYLRAKLATSLDGRTALANGASRWISSEASRNDAQALRARSSAILTGVGTVLADDPALTVRRRDLGDLVAPACVVLDSALRTPPAAQLIGHSRRTHVFCTRPEAARQRALEAAGASVEVVAETGGRPDPTAVLRRLAELGMNEVLLEAGPGVSGAMLDAGLIDEIVVYVAPHVLGADGFGMFATTTLSEMSARPEFDLADVRRIGPDCRLTFLKRGQ